MTVSLGEWYRWANSIEDGPLDIELLAARVQSEESEADQGLEADDGQEWFG